MSEENSTITVQILNKPYSIKCTNDHVQDLQQSALYLDSQLRETCKNTSIKGNERIAIMTALNISHELLLAKKQEDQYIKAMNSRIKSLHNRIEDALIKQEEIEL